MSLIFPRNTYPFRGHPHNFKTICAMVLICTSIHWTLRGAYTHHFPIVDVVCWFYTHLDAVYRVINTIKLAHEIYHDIAMLEKPISPWRGHILGVNLGGYCGRDHSRGDALGKNTAPPW